MASAARSQLIPRHVHRSCRWWFFLTPDLPERALLDHEGAFIDDL